MEASDFSEDSENRITTGGKRKSSSRRSSILKATKSPLKGGALEDLDLNSLDDNGRSRSKKSRQSSGRRVSFAKKDDVKEFFVEDWKSAWSKDDNLQMSSNAFHGDSEYRPPADSIKGIESLLEGNIQADSNDIDRVEVQEMPEAQFSELSTGDEVCYDRGILLQTITQASVQHTVPLDVTICHGPGIISAPNDDPDASRANPNEEIEYTKCCSSGLSSDLDQTRLFSGDTGIDLDITCSQQEAFFHDYPAQLSSHESLEQSGKIDSKSFLLSLGSKPSSTQRHELFSGNTGLDPDTTCSQQEAFFRDYPAQLSSHKSLEQSGKIDSKSFLLSLGSKPSSTQRHELFSGNTGIDPDTTCSQQEAFFHNYPAQLSSPEGLEQSGKIDTKSFLLSLGSKPSSTQRHELFSGNTGLDPDTTCSQQEAFFHDYPAQLSSPEGLEQSGKIDTKSFLLSLGSKPSSTQRHEVIQHTKDSMTATSKSNAYSKRQPLGKITDMQSAMKTRQEAGDQQSNVDEDVELTVCHSYKGLENILPKTKRRSIHEPVDIDVTSCYGPGLLKSLEKQESHNIHEVRSRVSGIPLNLSVARTSVEADLQAQAASEQTPPLDVTKCHGIGILPGNGMSVPGTDQTEVYNTDNSESLDLTVCQAEGEHDCDENLELTACHSYEVLDNSIPKTHQKNICEPVDIDVTSCYGPEMIKGCSLSQNHQNDQSLSCNSSSKLDSSLFLKSLLGSKQCSSATDSEYNDEMNLTISGNTVTVDKREQNKPDEHKLSMKSTFSCARTNEAVTDLSNSIRLRNAYLIKNPFRKTTEEQEQTSRFHENLDLTVCHSQLVLDSDTQRTEGRTLYEEADLEVTSCYGPGLIQSPGKEETCDDMFKSALNLSRSLRAASNASQLNGNTVFNKVQDLPSWNKTQQEESDVNDNLDLTTCHGQSFMGRNWLKTDRRSLVEPADIDVTSCHGVGLVETSGDNLQLTVRGQPGVDKSLPQANRRSFYEPADIDVTSCHGAGLVESSNNNLELTVRGQPSPGKSWQQASRGSFFEAADIDVTSCHGVGLVETSGDTLTVRSQSGLDKSLQQANRRSFYEPANIDVTSCHGPGLVKSFVETSESTVSLSQHVVNNNAQKTNRAVYGPTDVDVASYQGAGLGKSSGEDLELTSCHGEQALDNNTENRTRRSFYENTDQDVTSCHGKELGKSNLGSLQLPTCASERVLDINTESATRQSFYEHADLAIKSCSETGPIKSPDEPVINHDVGETHLNLTERTEASFHSVNATASLDKAEDFHCPGEVLQTTRAPANANKKFECTDYNADKDKRSAPPAVGLNQSLGDQITRNVDKQLSIICEESVSELSKKELREDRNVTRPEEEMQNTTLSPITLKKFLDITEMAFITKVNMRRSVAPSNEVEAPQTPKDKILSALVSKPKATCYEEAIPALESEITVMKEKIEQQEMELNASNPRVFMEAQSASKEELLAMQGNVRRLRSVCEKTSKREWKREKGQLNKRILLKMAENRQALASDVHVVEESLAMVDDCLNLLDKLNNDLDEGIKGFQLSLEENEKKLQEQANLSAKLESKTEALRKSEQELADLECTRSTAQSEKEALSNRKEQLDSAILENKEAVRLLKEKDPRSEAIETKRMQQRVDLLESLQEWSLEEWNEECARFTFLEGTLEMVVLFGSDNADSKDSFSDQEVKSIKLNFTPTEQFTGKMGKVHTLVKQTVNQDLLSQMCSSKKDLTKVLEHMSWIIFKSNEIGDELFRIALTHLLSFKENRFVVEFLSLQAFVKFVLHIQLDVQSYPNNVTFTVSSDIGRLSQTEIEAALNAVDAGPRYLRRLVEAAGQLLSKAKSTLNMPS